MVLLAFDSVLDDEAPAGLLWAPAMALLAAKKVILEIG